MIDYNALTEEQIIKTRAKLLKESSETIAELMMINGVKMPEKRLEKDQKVRLIVHRFKMRGLRYDILKGAIGTVVHVYPPHGEGSYAYRIRWGDAEANHYEFHNGTYFEVVT